ncbi:peptide-methionine (S)-S-oxide reductase MsrA [Stieleria sp. ICT_E10.1]|uniref:peptide-methionine (S)-S-oxide reductase MsrA n=1 Tax=Stieleria sedimenti TaxID=2976331 RepID=UPI00217F8AA0|nr:peptide-methionine (S)-S-oxide reductase MsrA [Stieleria sedimenti]MCS7469520.1 peptide-methionine (S)-S-oxide reductase MsrA [Stieleria sedimenti]
MNFNRHELIAAILLAAWCCVPSGAFADEPKLETATFGGGCYWCVEAVFQRISGVSNVRPGFMGGRIENPTYRQVLTGRTGHVEVIQLEFDPDVVTYETLLQVFWRTHDPTTKNRQGPDVGPQYRSVVFTHTDQQRDVAQQYKRLLNRQKAFQSPIVTSIERASTFYPADSDHEDYFNRNPDKPYCQAYIVPKLKKLQELFADQLKPDPVSSTGVQ